MLFPAVAHVEEYAPESRVWIYITDRRLDENEAQTAQEASRAFVRQWTAHNQALKATAELFDNQLLILMVDESQAGASGCSIDKSVHFLEALGHQLGVDFFERMRFGWVNGDRLQFGDRNALRAALDSAESAEKVLVVNTLVQNKKDLQEKWLTPFSQSWHRRLL